MPTIEIITLLESNPITGVVYGTKELHLSPVAQSANHAQAARLYQQAAARKASLVKKRAENTKHK